MTLAVTGFRTTIVQALRALLPAGEEIVRVPMDTSRMEEPLRVPKAERFLLAAGMLLGKPMSEYTTADYGQMLACNVVNPIRICEWVLATNPTARICVIGSESARTGSFDKVYAATKAALHAYVQQRRVREGQQLVLVSPPIILDSGMTARRPDRDRLVETRYTCSAPDVAAIVHKLLYKFEPAPGLSNYVQTIYGNRPTMGKDA